MPDALPAHLVEVDGFWMDRTPVTNAEFQRFVAATGYVTVAERPLEARTIFPACRKTCSCRARRCSARRRRLFRSTIRCSGGATRRARAGSIRRDHEQRTRRRRIIRSCTSRSRMRRRTRSGPASGCRPRPSSSSPRAADSIESLSVGQRPDTRTTSSVANIWQGRFPASDSGEDGYAGTSPVDGVSAERIRAARHGRQRLAVVRGLVPARLLRGACESGPGDAQSARAGRQLRSAGAGRRQARPERRLVPVHRSILRALPGRQPRKIGGDQWRFESGIPPGAGRCVNSRILACAPSCCFLRRPRPARNRRSRNSALAVRTCSSSWPTI